MNSKALLAIILFLGIAVLYSCAPSARVSDRGPGDRPGEEEIIERDTDGRTESGLELDRYRSSMADVYASLDHDIPERFLQTYEGRTVERDPFEGFRIQIYSDREVASADSIAGEFRVWADTTLSSQYEPDTYVFFKPPYYKVHVGDFHNRDQANEFAQIVKERHPDAWVVHDRVNPSEVPADSVEFKLRDPDEKENDEEEDEE